MNALALDGVSDDDAGPAAESEPPGCSECGTWIIVRMSMRICLAGALRRPMVHGEAVIFPQLSEPIARAHHLHLDVHRRQIKDLAFDIVGASARCSERWPWQQRTTG